MSNQDLDRLFAGADDERLDALFRSIDQPRNEVEYTFCCVWEASELLASDGFEMLFEQATSLDEYAACFVKIGMLDVKPIFDRVKALIPGELQVPGNEEAMWSHSRNLFDEMKLLLSEYYEKSKNLLPTIGKYVREHRADLLAGK